jgi:dolichol-phosphate mannosyltransferase
VLSVVVLPTYNERDNIVPILNAIRQAAPTAAVLVIDDRSPDGTGALAEQVAAELGQITVIHRDGVPGLGAAYRHGFAVALGAVSGDGAGCPPACSYDVVVSMDADFSHDPTVIPNMLSLIEGGADLVIGSRYVEGGGTVDWPLHRRLLSRWGNRYTGMALGLGVRDCTSGFRAYRGSTLAAIEPHTTSAEGYAFLTELVRRMSRQGASITETPIMFADRIRGTSKMSTRIIAESMVLVTRWGIVDRWRSLRRSPQR